MPTNQSAPWGGGKPQAHSSADGLTTMSVHTHPKTSATTKVPTSQVSQELPGREDQAKALSCHVASSVSSPRDTAALHFSSENGVEDKTQSQFTTVPERAAAPLLNVIETQNPNWLAAMGRKTSASSSVPKREFQVGFKGQKKRVSPQASHPGNGRAVSTSQTVSLDTTSKTKPHLPVSNEGFLIKGQSLLLQTNKSMVSRVLRTQWKTHGG